MMEKKMVYRVILRVGYNVAYFEFEESVEAVLFAQTSLSHMVSCDDTKKKWNISLEVVDPELEAKMKESEED